VIQLYAPYVYDAMNMMARAMQQAGSIDSAKYRPVLAAMEYPGLTSTIRFDTKGDLLNSPVSIYQAKNGQWQFLETASGQ
jgi:branched-chain amino acid transport system substrate-binding protein